MQEEISYLMNGSLITLIIILVNLLFFLGLPVLVAFYMKKTFTANNTQEPVVS